MSRPLHEHVASLLGAWVLGACSDEENRLVVDHISRCPRCAEDSLVLGGAAELLGGGLPRPNLRERMLAGARARRSPAARAPGYAAPYAALVSMLDALLYELSPEDWSTTVIYDWTVQDVLAHLSATDSVLADQIPPMAPAHEVSLDVDARTALLLARERGRRPAETRAAWRGRADALCAVLSEEEGALTVQIRNPMRLAGALVARAFETWIHGRDIALAIGRSLPSPLPPHLHAIADLGVRSLPRALALREGRRADGGRLQVDLSGAGGGAWDLPLGPGDGTATTIRLDVMDFCLLAADRRQPDEVAAELAGDTALGRRVLAAASTFAGP